MSNLKPGAWPVKLGETTFGQKGQVELNLIKLVNSCNHHSLQQQLRNLEENILKGT